MLDRGIEDEVLPYCREQTIAVIVYSPMKSGLLTGEMTRVLLRSSTRRAYRSY